MSALNPGMGLAYYHDAPLVDVSLMDVLLTDILRVIHPFKGHVQEVHHGDILPTSHYLHFERPLNISESR